MSNQRFPAGSPCTTEAAERFIEWVEDTMRPQFTRGGDYRKWLAEARRMAARIEAEARSAGAAPLDVECDCDCHLCDCYLRHAEGTNR